MNNIVYYIKSEEYDYPSAINEGFKKAFQLVKTKKYSNIKVILSSSSLLDSTPNHISNGLDKLFKGYGITITNSFKKNKSFSVPDFPETGKNLGLNLLLVKNNPIITDNETVILLIWADEISLKKIQSELSFSKTDLVAVVYNATPTLNEMLSASKAINISKVLDPHVIIYENPFDDNVNAILSSLRAINVTDGATEYAKEAMKDVVKKLTEKRINISFLDFLGYLINDVNFPLEHSLDLLASKKRYFNR